MLKKDVTCFMPQGILSIEVPIMVFQIMKLKTERHRERGPYSSDAFLREKQQQQLRQERTHMVTRLGFFPGPSRQLSSLYAEPSGLYT